jgi:hypothetical protein
MQRRSIVRFFLVFRAARTTTRPQPSPLLHVKHCNRRSRRTRQTSSRMHRRLPARSKPEASGSSPEAPTLITGGTDNHLLLVDMTPKNVGGKPYAKALDRAGLVANYNSIPFDPRKPMDPSGLRLGTAAIASRGMGPKDMEQIATWMAEVADHPTDEARQARIRGEVRDFCKAFPAPGILL